MTFHSCLICQKSEIHWHHIIKRRLKPNGVTVPLCPKHHKLADLGKIPVSELYRLKELEKCVDEIIYESMDWDKIPWETEYHRSDNFNDSHDFHCMDGELAFYYTNSRFHQYKRAKRIHTWLNSSPDVGTYLVGNEMFSYLKKGVPTFTRYARQ